MEAPLRSLCCRAIVLESDPGTRALLEELLAESSRELVVCEFLSEAKAAVGQGDPFNLAFVNERVADGRGVDLLRDLQARSPNLLIAIIADEASVESAMAAVRVGAVDYLVKPLDDRARIRNVIANATHRVAEAARRAELVRQLEQSEERLALALKATSEGLWDWDLTRNYIYLSTRWKAMLGFAAEELGNSPDEWFSRVHSDDLERFKQLVAGQLEAGADQFEIEYRIHPRDGSTIWVRTHGVCVRDDTGRVIRMVGSQIDITKQKQAEARLLHDALHDALTGLPNRALLLDRLEAVLSKLRRNPDRVFAVLFVDLDRFKNVNDSLGHAAGDELLVAIARRLEAQLRAEDTLARLGGDEFVVLLGEVDELGAVAAVVERLEEALRQPIEVRGHELVISASIGIAMSGPGYERAEDVLRDADIAMYRAKAAGRGGHTVFVGKMHEQAVQLLRLETDLRAAIGTPQCSVRYQPIVDVGSRRLAGFEALVRWKHPEQGWISPVEFIPIAEETGLIVELGEWVLREACARTRAWQVETSSGIFISVNVSPRQFSHPDLLQSIASALEDARLAPHHLKVEITEGVFIRDIDGAERTLDKLRDMDVQLSLDDFGTGYSSLSYLQRLPFDVLKVDRGFVTEMLRDQRAARLVEGVVTLGHALGLRVVAEGVESAAHLSALARIGCDFAQGYYLSPPLTEEDAAAVVRSPHFGETSDIEPSAPSAPRRTATLRYGESAPDLAAVLEELRDDETQRYGAPMPRSTRNTLRLLTDLGAELDEISEQLNRED